MLLGVWCSIKVLHNCSVSAVYGCDVRHTEEMIIGCLVFLTHLMVAPAETPSTTVLLVRKLAPSNNKKCPFVICLLERWGGGGEEDKCM